jgi:hypothetical protein
MTFAQYGRRSTNSLLRVAQTAVRRRLCRAGQLRDKMQLRRSQERRLTREFTRKQLKIMEALGRVELPTNGLGNRCSIHLSYRADAT